VNFIARPAFIDLTRAPYSAEKIAAM
jgi:hypothetical protein